MKTTDDQPLAGARVLVTGATGFTGSLLARKLAAQGARVAAIARPSSHLEPLAGVPVEWIRGEVFDEATVRRAAAGADYIFHVAAAYREAGLADDVYRQVHVASTQLLAQAARSHPGFKRFVHVSTVGVHGHVEHPPADERYRFDPGDIYQVTKAEAENWIRNFGADTGLPYVVLRPAAILGPGDRRLLKLFKMATRPFFVILGAGNLYHLVHVEDLTDIMMLAATHPAAAGEVFICGNERALTLEEIGRQIASVLGYPFRPLHLPVTPFFVAAAICEAVCRPLRIAPPLYRRRVAFFTKDRAFDTRKLREVLGYKTRYTNETGLAQTARAYVDAGWIRPGPGYASGG